MNNISIVNRELTSDEIVQMNSGFDELSVEEGVEIESSERFSIVALDGNSFIGCASGLASKNGNSFSGWFYITDLFVEKKFRSKGIGTKLLHALEAQMLILEVKHAWLWTSGDKALKFYSRNAYKEFTEFENWYSDGSNRIGLRKDF